MTGFFHEQSRSDRDSYVEINWNNIPSGQGLPFQYIHSSIKIRVHIDEIYDLFTG